MIQLFAVLLLLSVVNGAPKTNLTRTVTRASKISVPDNGFRIVGSKMAKISNYPYTAAIIYSDLLLGSGAILNKYWIISAANELRSYANETLTMRLGSEDATTGGQLLHTSRVILNEQYTGSYPYNVALVKLNASIEFGVKARPIKMANLRPKAGCKAVITGWGKQSAKANTGNSLQVAHVTVKSDIECQATHPALDVTKSICADADGVGPCYGDKGVPLVSKRKLVGHFIGGNLCNLVHFYEVYSNIAAYRKWVVKTIKQNSCGDEAEGIY